MIALSRNFLLRIRCSAGANAFHTPNIGNTNDGVVCKINDAQQPATGWRTTCVQLICRPLVRRERGSLSEVIRGASIDHWKRSTLGCGQTVGGSSVYHAFGAISVTSGQAGRTRRTEDRIASCQVGGTTLSTKRCRR